MRDSNIFVLYIIEFWGDIIGSNSNCNRNLVLEVECYCNKVLKYVLLVLVLVRFLRKI